MALPPPLAALPPTIAPRLVAPIPPLAPTATRYGGLALRDIAFGSSQGRLGKGGQGTVRLGRHYGGRLAVKHFGVGSSWRQPDATHIVIYSQKETGTKHLAGRVACKLAADNYGASEWWLLLELAPES